MNRPAPRSKPDLLVVPAALTVRRPRRLAVVAGVAALVALAGCTTQSPLQTQVPYQPADGVSASSGAVEARDLLLIAAAKGAPAYLSGSLINTGTDSVEVGFASQEAAASDQSAGSVQLKPREQVRIETITIPAVAAPPGALTNIVMKTPAGQVMVLVPVLLPTAGGPYASLTPTATSGTATSGTATSSASATPATTTTTTSTAAAG